MKQKQVTLLIAILCTTFALSGVTPAPANAAFDMSVFERRADQCRLIVSKAVETLQNQCNGLSRNNACYGNDRVTTEFDSTDVVKFDHRGDKIPIKLIKSLVTSPLDVDAGTWGLSLLKLQANLPNTMPGQNITFVVYGDTSVQNVSGDMQVFYFSSGIGEPTCTEMPPNGIGVQSPDHMKVAFTANGVKIEIASTIYMKAVPNKTMDITLIEGQAKITTATGSQTLQPGQSLSIPLGGVTGLEPIGTPSAPTKLDAKTAKALADVATQTLKEKKNNGNGGGNGNGNNGNGNNGGGNGNGNNGNGNGNGGGNGNGNNGNGGGNGNGNANGHNK